VSAGLIDVSEVILDPELCETFTRRRQTGSFDAHGVWKATYADTQIVGVVEPMSTQDIAMMPEGSRLADMLTFWSTSEMRTAAGKGTEPDILVRIGLSYRVLNVNPWPERGYFKAIAEGFKP